MSDRHDIFTSHYRLVQRDPNARRRLIGDPAAGLTEHFGSVPAGDYRIKVISQDRNKITILLPAVPANGDTGDDAIDAVSRRIYDILFTNGVGGYLIPDESLMWVLRDMRSSWSARDASAQPEGDQAESGS